MPQPYDYTVGQPPAQAFLQNLQLMGAVQGMREQQAAAQRQEAIRRALVDVQANPTPEGFANLYLQFPEMKENIDAYRSTLADADKGTLLSAAREALVLRQAGRTEEVADLFTRYAEAAQNSNRPDLAKQFEDAGRFYAIDPDNAGDFALRMMYQGLDPDGYKTFFGEDEPTELERQVDFIRETYGEDAAAEFAQFGRGGVVSIPLGNGQTYVGPASTAPGASRWREQGEPEGIQRAPEILQNAEQSKTITAAEAGVIQRSLGPNGRAKFQEWLQNNGVKVIVRTGTAPDGRRVVQYEDGTVDYQGDAGGNASGGFRE